jgi:hypothetical protein
VETACVQFAEEQITGLELLERSGIPVIAQVSGMGAAVCKIGPDGCNYPAEGCFCKRDGPRAIYWAYYLRQGDAWVFANRSAGGVLVGDGDVQGWAWGLGDSAAGAMPPALGFDAVCGSAAAAPAEPPPPTAAPPTAVPTEPAPTTAPPAAAPTLAPAVAPTTTLAPTEAPTTPPITPSAAQPGGATAAPTLAPTLVPTTTLAPTEAPTEAPTDRPSEPALAPTGVAGGSDPSPAAPQEQPAAPWSYLGFGALALILAAGAAIVARRPR